MQVSWDQHAAHTILEKWVDRALLDEQITGIGTSSVSASGAEGENDKHGDRATLSLRSRKVVSDMRKEFIKEKINAIDLHFGRTLGCRMSKILGAFVDPDNHHTRNAMGWIKVRGKWKVRNRQRVDGQIQEKLDETNNADDMRDECDDCNDLQDY